MEQNTYATIITHDFSPHAKIRVIKKKSGPAWLSIEDVCKATGIIPAHVLRDIDPAHQATFIAYDGQENIETEIEMISFERLQKVVAASRLVRARAFLQWVEKEIMGIDDDPEDPIELVAAAGYESGSVDMRTFNFKNSEDHKVRTIIKEDGSIWFVASDVATVLGYAKPGNAIITHCKYGEKMTSLKQGSQRGGTQDGYVLN